MDNKSAQIDSATKKMRMDYLINIMRSIEALYSEHAISTQFLLSQWIFSTVPDAACASNKYLENSQKELQFLLTIYSKYSIQTYLLLTRPNAGGEKLSFIDSDEEDVPTIVKEKLDPDSHSKTHIAECIFNNFPILSSSPPTDNSTFASEYEYIKQKILLLYKFTLKTDKIFDGGDVEKYFERVEEGIEGE
jgi:hypothetical protein